MKPLEALDLLNRATSIFSGTRSDHVQIQEALRVLEEHLKDMQDKCDTEGCEDKKSEETQPDQLTGGSNSGESGTPE